MDPDIRVEFHVRGKNSFFDEITRLLGIHPTRVFNNGDSVEKTKIIIKENIWCISIENKGLSDNLSDFIMPIVEKLYIKREKLNRICKEKDLYCEMACTIYIIENSPTIFLEPDIMLKLAEMNINLNIDIVLTK